MKTLIICLLIICGLHLEAQQSSVKMTSLPAGSVLEANFIQYRNLTGVPKPIKSEGHMILWEGKGLIWATSSPFPNTLLITKKGLYQQENRTKTPIVKAGGENAMFDVMAGIFKMDYEIQDKGFTIEELPSNNNNWQIRLIPQYSQVQNFIKSILVEGNTHITRITIFRPNGDYDQIDIKDHLIKKNIMPEIRNWLDE